MGLVQSVTPNTNRFVNPPAGYDSLNYGFHHRKNIAAGAQTGTLSFFDGAGGTTLLETNLTRGTISKENAFLLQFVNCEITVNAETGLVTDTNVLLQVASLHMIMHRSLITLSLGPTEYFTLPTWRVPAGGGITGVATGGAAAATDFAALTNGIATIHNAYPVRIPLESQDDIKWGLNWPASATTTLDMAVTMVMTGLLLRPTR